MDVETAQLLDRDTADAFYEGRYGRGYMDAWPAWKTARIRELVRSLDLPQRGDALDFGCGSGVFTAVLRDALPGWRVCGSDPSPTAIANARARVAGCDFFALDAAREHRGTFDFVFSHHVLEHVADLEDAWTAATGFLKPAGAMLHVLPCGNEGSLEHRLCALRRDGIDAELGGRFFFEDVGHVRRLRSAELVALAESTGFFLAAERYANQHDGTRRWMAGEPALVAQLLDPAQALDAEGWEELRRLLRPVRRDARAGAFLRRYAYWRGVSPTRVKHRVALIAGAPLALLARVWLRRLDRLADAEWRRHGQERNGSEMLLVFRRKA